MSKYRVFVEEGLAEHVGHLFVWVATPRGETYAINVDDRSIGRSAFSLDALTSSDLFREV